MSLEHISEIIELVETGDINLDERRTKFKEIMGRDTKLGNPALIRAIAMTDDDDDTLFCENVVKVEEGG